MTNKGRKKNDSKLKRKEKTVFMKEKMLKHHTFFLFGFFFRFSFFLTLNPFLFLFFLWVCHFRRVEASLFNMVPKGRSFSIVGL